MDASPGVAENSDKGEARPADEDGRLYASDGLRLAYSLYLAPRPRATLIVCHGFAEHRKRYRHLIAALVPKGINVLTFDLRGHGESGGGRGFLRHFDTYLDDLDLVLDFARERLDAPLVLFGHSMGGLIAVRFLQERASNLKGVALSNPALELRMAVPNWKMILAGVVGRFAPGFQLPSGIAPELISRDPDEVRRYIEDPLVFDHATVRWATEFMRARTEALAAPGDFAPASLLVMLGMDDGIVDPNSSRTFFERCASPDRQILTFDHHRHELINEPLRAREEVLAELSTFVLRSAEAST